MIYREFKEEDIEKLLKLTDDLIGINYYSYQDLYKIYKNGFYKGEQLSIIIEDKDIIGFRFTLAPNTWLDKKIAPELWGVKKEEVAYFQSIFIAKHMTGQGIGRIASLKSIEKLKRLGVKAVVCHSHVESPNNSSQKYLLKLGFKNIKEYPLFWSNIDYLCDTCKVNPCKCTAREMIKVLYED